MTEKSNISYQQEILRKGIHLLSLSIPLIYIFISKELALTILVPLALAFTIVDLLGRRNNSTRSLMNKYFGKMLRPHEKEGKGLFNGATWVLISAVICVAIFPKIITVTGFTILIISDILAALIGRKYGRYKIFDKTWEGTIAFIISAMIIVFIYYWLFALPTGYLISGLIAAVVGGFVEVTSKKMMIDDNLSIPVSIGIVMWLGAIISEKFGDNFLNIMM